MRIWKTTLNVTDVQAVEFPEGAKLLTVQMQHERPQLWALVDENAPIRARQVAIYGTGNPIPNEPGEYIATFQMHGGSLVFHVFEIKSN
jgi:hypothetical protein